MITKICYSEICFDEPAVLEQVKKLYKNPLSSSSCTMCAVLYRCFFECYLRCDYHLDCKLSYFGGRGKCAEIKIIDISAMGWAIALICVCVCVCVCVWVWVCVWVCGCVYVRVIKFAWAENIAIFFGSPWPRMIG